jgi:putative methyltransferase (TIGR04325 family)
MLSTKFKKLFFEICPPIILSVIRLLKSHKSTTSNITYEGVYLSFSEVRKAFPKAISYHTDESANDVVKEGEIALIRAKNKTPPIDGMALIRHNFLPTFISALEQESINVFDIGGGYGTAFLSSLYSCPNIKIKSTVLELPNLISMYQKIYLNEQIDFISDLSNIKVNDFDIIYFGSSLQYFENYMLVLEKIIKLGARYIMISDTPMGEFETFVCAQVNMKDNVIPILVFSVEEITKLISGYGYKIVHQSINYYPFHNFDNYPLPISSAKHMNIIFKRN